MSKNNYKLICIKPNGYALFVCVRYTCAHVRECGCVLHECTCCLYGPYKTIWIILFLGMQYLILKRYLLSLNWKFGHDWNIKIQMLIFFFWLVLYLMPLVQIWHFTSPYRPRLPLNRRGVFWPHPNMSRFQTRDKMRKITGTKSSYCTGVLCLRSIC